MKFSTFLIFSLLEKVTKIEKKMFFFVFSKLSIQTDVYRTSFYVSKPSNFQESKYSQPFTKQVEKVKYNCYVSKEPRSEQTVSDPEEYLKSHLSGTCQTFTHTKYWYFSFCPFSNLTQYRFDNTLINKIDNFLLGSDDNQKSKIIKNGIAFDWLNGDICFATKKPRTVHVEYICDHSVSSEGVVASISESSFCNYIVKYNTRLACAVPNVHNESVYDIECYSTSNTVHDNINQNANNEKTNPKINIQKGKPIKKSNQNEDLMKEDDTEFSDESSDDEPTRSWMDLERALNQQNKQKQRN